MAPIGGTGGAAMCAGPGLGMLRWYLGSWARISSYRGQNQKQTDAEILAGWQSEILEDWRDGGGGLLNE